MTAPVTNTEASRNILAFAREGRLTQRSWHDRDAEGREIACLLGAIHPSVTSAAECNAELMPLWLAELTPTLFDGLNKSAITPIATRYGELVGRWYALTDEDWREVLKSTLIYLHLRPDRDEAELNPIACGPMWRRKPRHRRLVSAPSGGLPQVRAAPHATPGASEDGK